MDEGDVAKAFQDETIDRALANRTRHEGIGREICIDCKDPIPEARRKAVPGCDRCVQCQGEFEEFHEEGSAI